jgi:hypothetical protein
MVTSNDIERERRNCLMVEPDRVGGMCAFGFDCKWPEC